MAARASAIVFPLDRASKSELPPWIGEGIALSISTQINSRELRTIDRDDRIQIVESLDLPPGAPLSHGSMIRVAQRADANLVIMGAYSGSERNLRISIRLLEVKSLKLSGEMVANGPVSALPQIENELAWLILSNNGLNKDYSRPKFQEKTRKIPNLAYSCYIQSLTAPGEKDQIQLLLKAVSSYRDFPEAQFRLGRLYFRKGDCGSALPHLVLGRSNAEDQVESDFMRGTCYIQSDQLSQAIQSLWGLKDSRSYESLNNLAVAYLRKGDLALATNALLDSRNLARNNETVILNLALVRHLQGNDTEALSLLEEAVKSNPKSGLLHFLLANVLMAKGEPDKAIPEFSKAKGLGIKTEKLQAEEPKMWSRVFSALENR